MEDLGFTFHLGAKTQEIAPGPDGLMVNLESGEKLKGDLVLISAGVRPDLSLAPSPWGLISTEASRWMTP